MSKLTTPGIISMLLLLYSSIFPSLVFSTKCHDGDKEILLNIKAEFGNPVDLQWTSDTDCCSWRGVTCESDTGRVNILEFNSVNVSGRIPFYIGLLPLLSQIHIRSCPSLTGNIPRSISNLHLLTSLTIVHTNLSGPIPTVLGMLTNLNDLNLSYNRFTGSIPEAISTLPRLYLLSLSNNKLTGTIPQSLFRAPPRREWLDLSNNLLTGEIPRSLGRADMLFIFLSGNRLTGDPSFLFGRNRAVEVDLSNNQLEMNMSSLIFPRFMRMLDLSRNRIYGTIPDSIYLPIVHTFNVSHNLLCGRIPTDVKYFEESCFMDNKCLCGTPLPSCPLISPTAIHGRSYVDA